MIGLFNVIIYDKVIIIDNYSLETFADVKFSTMMVTLIIYYDQIFRIQI